MVDVLLVDEQSHALLALVCYYLLCRERLVAYRQLCHVNLSAALLYKFRQAVEVSCRAVVVYADNRIGVFLAQGTHKIVGTLLHFGVGTLHSVELYAV